MLLLVTVAITALLLFLLAARRPQAPARQAVPEWLDQLEWELDRR